MFTKSIGCCTGGLVLIALTGCASTPPPRETLAKADLALQEAARQEAIRYEPGLMASAREKYDRAVRDMNDDHNLQARRLAEESLIEARLATVRSEAARQSKDTSEVRKAVDDLKDETVNHDDISK